MYKTKITMEDIKERCHYLYNDEYTILNDIYINNKSKIYVRHNKCENSWETSTHSFINQGRKCPECFKSKKLTLQGIKERCIELNGYEYTILTDEYKGNKEKFSIIHNLCGNIYKISFNQLSHKKSKCPFCNGKKVLNIDIIKKRCYELYNNEYNILSNDYINASCKIRIKHNKCLHEWFSTSKSFFNCKRGCPKCNESIGETKIRKYLSNKNIIYESQKTFDNCFYICKLKFDFYLPNQNMCIEFDGEQHYKPVEYFGGENKFELIKKRDNVKNNYCFNNNINLIRISYLDIKNIELILNEKINFLHI